MKFLTKLLALTATIVMAGAMNSASATMLSFGVTGTGSAYTVNTGNITALTTSKTLASTETVGACAPGSSCLLAGITPFVTPAIFSTLTLHTTLGADVFTLTVGLETFTFASVDQLLIVPTGVGVAGSIAEQIDGVVTSGNPAFAGQTVSISETCTQTTLGAIITCSESVATPGLPVRVPEPMSLALLGIGLAGLGVASRRRKS